MKPFLQSHWKLTLAINLSLGIALWFGYVTDVSLRGTLPDILFPLFVAIFARNTLDVLPNKNRWLSKLGYMPSIIGGCLPVLIGLILLIPPFTLGFLFSVSEIFGEVRIQQIPSPNNINLAEVYFRPVGGYTSGSGRIYIKVSSGYIPFVERDIYSLKSYSATEETANYVRWLDNDTIYVSESDESISVGGIKIPIIQSRIYAQEKQKYIESLFASLHEIPIFPGTVTKESVVYHESRRIAVRNFRLSKNVSDEVYEWYKNALSQSPWEIIGAEKTLPEYCIKVRKVENGKAQLFYISIYSTNDNIPYVSYTTPNAPAVYACQQIDLTDQ